MGKKTMSPRDSRAEISDLLVEQTTSDCPLQRKGDICIIVAWKHDESPVAGVPVTLTGGRKTAQGTTDKQGRVMFKKRDPGAYVYEADFSNTQARMPVTVVARDSASIKRDKLVTVFVYIEETGALRVEVHEDDKGRPGAMLPDADVENISGGGCSQDSKALVKAERIPAQKLTVAVRLNADLWRLAPDQDLDVTIKPGEEVSLILRAQKLSWVQLKVIEVHKDGVKDAEAPVERAIVKVRIEDAPQDLVSIADGIAKRTRIVKPEGDLAVDEVAAPGADIYLFEEFV